MVFTKNKLLDQEKCIVCMENCSHKFCKCNAVIHKSKIIKETIENDNNHLLYSVPYHPEINSIEEFFSQLKHYIKKESPNTYDNIYKVITYKFFMVEFTNDS